jgi:hypothetical protein
VRRNHFAVFYAPSAVHPGGLRLARTTTITWAFLARPFAPLVPYFKIAKPKAERMNTERAPAAALDDILNQARHVLLDFDGPVCSLFAGTPTAPVMGDLASALLARCGNLG